jgi:redox-sensing transcriptional repressor
VRSRRPARVGIPEATVSRLPLYLQALTGLTEHGVATVSSDELARAAGVGSAKLRKDLSHLGSYGTRGVGYEVEYLVSQISRALGLTQDWRVVIVGIGNPRPRAGQLRRLRLRGFTVAARWTPTRTWSVRPSPGRSSSTRTTSRAWSAARRSRSVW